MATPCKFDIKASKKVGALTSALLTLLELHGQEGYALERAFYDGYNAVKEAHGRTQTALNAAVECCKVLEEIVSQGNAKTCLMAFAEGLEDGVDILPTLKLLGFLATDGSCHPPCGRWSYCSSPTGRYPSQ